MRKNKIYEIVAIAMLLAITIVLQLISTFMRIGAIPITLTLIPIVVGAILFGKKGGVILGATFGIVVTIQCATGLDPEGHALWNFNPIGTAIVCIFKGTMAGFVPAIVFKQMKKVNFNVAVVVAACSAPITNTIVFILGMYTFFYSKLVESAGGSKILVFVFAAFIGINLLVEFLINVILSPAIIRIIEIVKKEE